MLAHFHSAKPDSFGLQIPGRRRKIDAKEKKQQRIVKVKALLEAFSKEHLSPELSGYVFKLWGQIGRKRNYVITGGKKEVWASAVVYAIARLNFLFDSSRLWPPLHGYPRRMRHTRSPISGYPGARKASACLIHVGVGLCLCKGNIYPGVPI